MENWFWARVAATEGDLTVGRDKLDAVAKHISENYLQFGIIPCYATAIEGCKSYGFDYYSLLEEERDYLDEKVEELING